MKYRPLLWIAAALMPLAIPGRCALAAATQTPPATMPSTQPAAFSIRGAISVEQSWTLRAPDLSRVVVYLASDHVLDAQSSPVQLKMDQYRKAFDPDFLIAPAGFYHRIPKPRSLLSQRFQPFARVAPPFDLDRFDAGYEKSRVFNTPGVIHIFCNIHPLMHGMIVVTPNAIATRATPDGKFQLPPVPTGHYTLVAWYERSGETRQDITVSQATESQEFSIRLKENRESVLANVPPDHGKSYGVERGLGMKRERLDLPVVTEVHPTPPSERR